MEAKFKEYAKLLVEVGVNIQKGQTLVIGSPVDCAWFARLCARAAYAAGCREVVMRWSDDELTREKYLHAEDSVFDSLPAWQAEFDNGYARQGAAFLHISARDPENLVGVDPDRIARSQRSSGEALREYRELTMSNTVPWCIGSIPIPSWARKVFPGCPDGEAVEKLWEAIFQTVRVDGSGAAVDRWREHLAGLKGHMDRLNGLNLESLHYTNSLGTDLTIRLPEGHIWAAGSSETKSGLPFIANMPTEEVFTAPLRNGVDGVVCSSPGPQRRGHRQDPLPGQGGQNRGGQRPDRRGRPEGRHHPGRGRVLLRRGGAGALRQPHQPPEAALLQHPF